MSLATAHPNDVINLDSAPADLNWQAEGRCRETDPDAFHPEQGASPKPAQKVCGKCEVRLQCLLYALQNDERHGIWGGMTPRERRQMAAEIAS